MPRERPRPLTITLPAKSLLFRDTLCRLAAHKQGKSPAPFVGTASMLSRLVVCDVSRHPLRPTWRSKLEALTRELSRIATEIKLESGTSQAAGVAIRTPVRAAVMAARAKGAHGRALFALQRPPECKRRRTGLHSAKRGVCPAGVRGAAPQRGLWITCLSHLPPRPTNQH